MDSYWYLAMESSGPGCEDAACFFLMEIDEQRRVALLDHWFAYALAEKPK